MDILEQLEKSVEGLLDFKNGLIQENERLKSELDRVCQERADFEARNNELQAQLAQEQEARAEALRRAENLLRRIQDQVHFNDQGNIG